MLVFKFVTIMITVLALLPGGAHLLELINKIDMPEAQYYIVQSIYRGWQYAGIVWAAALLANALLAYRLRGEVVAFRWAAAATILLVAAFAIFFAFTFPANVATQNCTVQPPHSIELRMAWEYSHAANAIVVFAALCCSTLAALLSRK